uniref:Uncharacterized protein n=1 Tax=Anguilla anguilla TaxID=7936 RepID=A0A0E9X0W6_ANGAN
MPGVCSSPPAALAKTRRGYTNLCIDRCILDLIAFQHRRMSFDLGIISDQIIIHADFLRGTRFGSQISLDINTLHGNLFIVFRESRCVISKRKSE